MPIARVRLPDGRIARFEVAEGTTPEEVEAEAAKLTAQTPQRPAYEPSTPEKIGIHLQAARDTLFDTSRFSHWGDALRSTAMGAGDLILGAGQLASKAMGPDQSQSYGDAMRTVEQWYQGGRVNPQNPDIARFTGSVAAAGAAAGAGGVPAATLPGRMVQGAKIGGVLGTSQPVDPDANYATSKAIQIGTGVVTGAAAPAVVESIIRGTGAAVNWLANSVRGMKNTLTGASNPANIEAALSEQLQRAGVAWSRVPQDAREMLVNEVRKAIRSGGTLDEESTKRLGDFLRLKIQPTQGQVSRDPLQYAREVNYSKAEFGKPLAERFTEQNRQLIGTVDELRTGTGAKGGDPYAAGQNVIADLRATDAATKGKVDVAYTQARSLAGLDSEVPAAPVADRVGRVIEEFGSDRIPGDVAKRLNEFGFMGGKGTKLLTIREAEKLKTLIGNNIDNPNTPSGKALTLLKQGIDDAINGIGDDAGAQAAGAFRQARGLAAQRFENLRRTPGLEKAISRDPGAPEKFLETEIIRGDVKDVANLMFKLRPEARAEVRAAVLDWIKGKGVSGVEDTAKFTQAGFNKALETLGERKLKLIFAGDKEALKQLQALGRVGAYVQNPPVASGVNYSNTFTSGLDFMDQVSRLPGLNLISGRVGDMVRAAQAANAVGAVSPALAGGPAIPSALLDRLAREGGVLSSVATPQAALEMTKKKRAKGALYRD
jgi:hypothetical protein